MKDLVVLYLSNDYSQVYASFIYAYVAPQIVIVLLQVPNTLVQNPAIMHITKMANIRIL